jgi:N-acetylglucosaminyldiphosphoundecaprenol N-acetyl-beta-D-mannosaminyltransferase
METSQRITVPFLGVELSVIRQSQVQAWIREALNSSEPQILAGQNLHSAYIWHTDEAFREFYESPGLILADGFPVVACLRAFTRGRLGISRTGSTDWLPSVMSNVDRFRVAVIGAMPEANSTFCQLILQRSPQSVVKGWHGKGWAQPRSSEILSEVGAFEPHLTLVALGMPEQEWFANKLLAAGTQGVIATVGGAVDQLTGVQKNAPRWLGAYGLEWTWRLFSQPRRLAHRYLAEPWKLVFVIIRRCARHGRSF